VLAPFRVSPVTELVVRVPVVLTSPPPLSVMAFPEVIVIPPDVLETAACTNRSFAPVVVSATVPRPPAVTAAPIVSTPVVAVRLMLPPLPVGDRPAGL